MYCVWRLDLVSVYTGQLLEIVTWWVEGSSEQAMTHWELRVIRLVVYAKYTDSATG